MPSSPKGISRHQARRFGRVLKIGYLAITVALAAVCLFAPIPNLLARLAPDDAFYYMKIARNASELGRITFDGINWTNGFHPLWGWLLMGFLAPWSGFSPEALFRGMMLLNVLLFAGAGWVFCHAWRRWMPQAWTFGLPAYVGLILFSYCYLMETALVLLLTGLVLQWLGRQLTKPKDCPLSWVGLGVLLAMLGLARPDMIFLGAGVFLAAMMDLRRRTSAFAVVRLGTTAIVTAAIPLGLWFVHTRASSGHWSTISSRLKLHLSDPHFHQEYLLGLWGWSGMAIMVLSVVVLIAVIIWRIRIGVPLPAWAILLGVLGGSNIAFALFQIFFVSGAFVWAVVPLRLMAVAVSIVTVHWLWNYAPNRATAFAGAAAVLIVLLMPGVMLALRLADSTGAKSSWTSHAFFAARWARENLPAGSVCASKDAGVFAWFSELPTVNLDGLVNSWEYQDALRDEHHLLFLRACGVTHLFQHNVTPDGLQRAHRFFFKSNFYQHEAMPLYLQPLDIVYQSEPFEEDGHPVHFVIWRFHGGT